MKQNAQITFEREETVLLKQGGSYVREFCPKCDGEVLFVTADVLALIAGSNEREIFRQVEAGTIHFVEFQRTYACSECCRRVFSESDPPAAELNVRGELS